MNLPPKNILIIHNYYTQPGGEDEVVKNEIAMLQKHGHSVFTYFKKSSDIKELSALQKILFLFRIIYNRQSIQELKVIIKTHKIEMIHIHNFWPLISPSIFFYFNRIKMPYIQVVHNYRYIVANALLYQNDVDQKSMNLTIKKRTLHSFRNSLILTLIYKLTSLFVIKSGVINNGSGKLQLLNEISYQIHKQRFKESSLCIRGNFLPNEHVKELQLSPKDSLKEHFLYIGRLSEEKGIITLIEAYISSKVKAQLIIAGTGPLEKRLKEKYLSYPEVQFVGYVCGNSKNRLLSNSKALILPSEVQEVFPISIIEATFSKTPIIASRIGGIPELIEHQKTGLLFTSRNSSELSKYLIQAEKEPTILVEYAENAYKFACTAFTEENNYSILCKEYEVLINK